MIIGLTGGIGSGKSTVAKMFKDLGVPVYNSDDRAKKLMRKSKKLKSKIINLLGTESYINGKLNRSYIAEKVFKNKQLLLDLNGIVHPAVRKNFLKWTKKQEASYVLQETALLFENEAQHFYDKTILVVASKEHRINRILKRDETTRAQILARMDNQLDDDAKIKLADFVIENEDLERTLLKVREIHKLIIDSH